MLDLLQQRFQQLRLLGQRRLLACWEGQGISICSLLNASPDGGLQILCVGAAESRHPLAPDKYFKCVLVISKGRSAVFSTKLKFFVEEKKKKHLRPHFSTMTTIRSFQMGKAKQKGFKVTVVRITGSILGFYTLGHYIEMQQISPYQY